MDMATGLVSMGMPGFSGFPSELTILIGAWQVSPLWALLAAAGVLVAAAFTLRVIQLSFFGKVEPAAPSPPGPAHDGAALHPLPPLTWPERTGALLLLAATLVIGLKPDLLLNLIVPSLQSPVMQAALRGGAP